MGCEMKVGIFGGTFDPIHYGHLKVASLGLRNLSLTEVLFVPAKAPWMKKTEKISPLVDREKMLAIALRGFSYFTLYNEPEKKPGASYSIDLVSHILNQKKYKAAELFLFIGDDHLESLFRWKEVDRLLSIVTLVCFSRKINDNKPMGTYKSSGESIGVPGAKILEISAPLVSISGNAIRARTREECPISTFSTSGVGEYIRLQKLYKN